MRAPGFWWQPRKTLAARLLAPLGWAYSAVAAWRMAKPAHRTHIPVICIGNFTAGGAGKTPAAMAVAGMLHEAGETPFFLSRGYGGTEEGPLFANPSEHSPARVGDEPLLLARQAPAVVARDRIAGAHLCREEGATAIIMDDGMQNPSLAKNLTLAVVDGQTGIGNGLVLPAGPLRMAMRHQWPLADAVVIVGPGAAGEGMAEAARTMGKPVFQAALRPNAAAAARLNGRKVLAFAGIGRPEKFFATLRAVGAQVEREIAFPDHHTFTDDELAALIAEARSDGLVPVTTEKDFIRITLPDNAAAIETLPVELVFTSGDIAGFITGALRQGSPSAQTAADPAGSAC